MIPGTEGGATCSHAARRQLRSASCALSFATALLGVPNAALADDDRKMGCDATHGWWYNDLNETTVTPTGAIVWAKRNTGAVSDGDWNIWLRPDSQYAHYARNPISHRQNQARDGDDGVQAGDIEMEVHSPPSEGHYLSDRFPPGTRVRAYGHWVHDTGAGHHNKTELHPLMSLIGIESSTFSWFVAQDDAERFQTAFYDVWDFQDLVIRDEWTAVRPGEVVVSHTRILEEDVLSLNGGELTISQGPGYVSGVTRLYGNVPGCLGWGTGVVTSPPYGRDMIADYKLMEADLIRDSVTFTVVPIPDKPGKKMAVVRIEATLSSPPQGALVFARWYFRSTSGFTGDFVETTSCGTTSGPSCKHKFSLYQEYAPLEGAIAHSWRVAVAAGTKDDFTVSDASAADATFVQDGRNYILPASKVSLRTYDKRSGPRRRCSDLIYVDLVENLMPGVSAISAKFWAAEIVHANGVAVPASAIPTLLTSLTPGTPLLQPSTTATLQSDRKRVEVAFEHPASAYLNRAIVLVQVEVETDLGEKVKTKILVDAGCFGGLPRHDAAIQLARYSASRGYSSEPYEFAREMRRMRPEDQGWGRAYLAWMADQPIDEAGERALLAALERAKAVPADLDEEPVAERRVVPKVGRGVRAEFAKAKPWPGEEAGRRRRTVSPPKPASTTDVPASAKSARSQGDGGRAGCSVQWCSRMCGPGVEPGLAVLTATLVALRRRLARTSRQAAASRTSTGTAAP